MLLRGLTRLPLLAFTGVIVLCSSDYGRSNDYRNYDEREAELPASNCEGFWIRPLNRNNSNHAPSKRCVCNATHVACINLQMTPPPPGDGTEDENADAKYFMQLDDDKFSQIDTITIHGNNLEKLPKRLFGPGEAHKRLKHLNLSSNYFIGVNTHAFDQGLKSLGSLVLSDNEMILTQADTDIFRNLPALKELYLRRSFNHYRSKDILGLLDKALRTANLRHLEKLELSGNHFKKIPKLLGCYLKNLKYFSFQGNYAMGWDVVSNRTCFSNLESLDLNFLARDSVFGPAFLTFLKGLPEKAAISIQGLQMTFDESLIDLMVWMNSTQRSIVTDKTIVIYSNGATKYMDDAREFTFDTLKRHLTDPPPRGGAMRSRLTVKCLLIALFLYSFTSSL